MLQKDGDNISKGIEKIFKKELELVKNKPQVVFKLVNSIYDGKKKKPRSWATPNAYSTSDDHGNVSEFLYYKSKKNNQTKLGTVLTEYLPPSITFSPRGDLTVNAQDKDLIIFMLNHPRRAKNKNGSGSKRPLFYMEDKKAEAKEKVASEAGVAKMKKLIYDEDDRLPEEKLRVIAKSLRVGNVDLLSLEEVQVGIEQMCRYNPNKFLSSVGLGKDVTMKSNLQSAIESGILRCDKGRWTLLNKDTNKTQPLATVRKSEDEVEALISWFKNVDEEDTYGKVMELLTGQVQPSKKSQSNGETEILRAEAEKLKAENENLKLKLQLANAEEEKPKKTAPQKK